MQLHFSPRIQPCCPHCLPKFGSTFNPIRPFFFQVSSLRRISLFCFLFSLGLVNEDHLPSQYGLYPQDFFIIFLIIFLLYYYQSAQREIIAWGNCGRLFCKYQNPLNYQDSSHSSLKPKKKKKLLKSCPYILRKCIHIIVYRSLLYSSLFEQLYIHSVIADRSHIVQRLRHIEDCTLCKSQAKMTLCSLKKESPFC